MTGDLLPKVLPFIYQGLQDTDDDNRAVAASALIPVADNLVQILPTEVYFSFSLLYLNVMSLKKFN